MQRRGFLASTAAAWLVGPGASARGVPRIGYITAGDIEPGWTLFRKAMAELGYVDGCTVAIELRNADAASGRLGELAAELVALKVNVIVAVLSPAIAAAKRATSNTRRRGPRVKVGAPIPAARLPRMYANLSRCNHP